MLSPNKLRSKWEDVTDHTPGIEFPPYALHLDAFTRSVGDKVLCSAQHILQQGYNDDKASIVIHTLVFVRWTTTIGSSV